MDRRSARDDLDHAGGVAGPQCGHVIGEHAAATAEQRRQGGRLAGTGLTADHHHAVGCLHRVGMQDEQAAVPQQGREHLVGEVPGEHGLVALAVPLKHHRPRFDQEPAAPLPAAEQERSGRGIPGRLADPRRRQPPGHRALTHDHIDGIRRGTGAGRGQRGARERHLDRQPVGAVRVAHPGGPFRQRRPPDGEPIRAQRHARSPRRLSRRGTAARQPRSAPASR
jgi:hypothetical protein